MIFVAPSYKDYPRIGEPFEQDGKIYIKILKNGKEKTVRGYQEWQNSWPAALKPRVERRADSFLAFNYPDGRYGYIVGIRSVDGREGFWKYNKVPEKNYSWAQNLVLSPLFGYIGSLEKPPIDELEPQFVSADEVRIDGGFKRLVSDEWYQNELRRLQKIWGD